MDFGSFFWSCKFGRSYYWLHLSPRLTLTYRWITALISCGALLAIAVLYIWYLSDSNIWSLGFRTVNVHSTLGYVNAITANVEHAPTFNALIMMVLLANTPQLLLTVLYFLYNSMYTRMIAASEWSQFAL